MIVTVLFNDNKRRKRYLEAVLKYKAMKSIFYKIDSVAGEYKIRVQKIN